MSSIETLDPDRYRRIPWKNGRGEMVVIAGDGDDNWQNVGWHFGRTAIIEEGPFSDYTGFERLQVVIKGRGLVLVAPDHEIDLRLPMIPRRYDGGIPVRTRLEAGPVEVVNLIAVRSRFDIDLTRIGAGARLSCKKGVHVVYAPISNAKVEIDARDHTLGKDHALRLTTDAEATLLVKDGDVLVGSIHVNV